MFYILLYLSLWWMTSGHSSSAINGKSMHGLLLRFCISRLTVVSRAAKKLQSARPIKRRAATTVSYLRVGPVSQY